MNLQVKSCQHIRARWVGTTCEGLGTVLVTWCPECGALKRTMTNWRYTDYPWELPQRKSYDNTGKT